MISRRDLCLEKLWWGLYLSWSLSLLSLADKYVNAFKMNEGHVQEDFTGMAEIIFLQFSPLNRGLISLFYDTVYVTFVVL